MYLKCHLCS